MDTTVTSTEMIASHAASHPCPKDDVHGDFAEFAGAPSSTCLAGLALGVPEAAAPPNIEAHDGQNVALREWLSGLDGGTSVIKD